MQGENLYLVTEFATMYICIEKFLGSSLGILELVITIIMTP